MTAAAITTAAGMTTLRVRAELTAGIADAPWGISLDGLLAAELHDELKTHDPDRWSPLADCDTVEDLPLPLARCNIDTERWHWAATCGQPDIGPDHVDVQYWMSRLDDRHAEQVSTQLPRQLSDQRGRYRTRYMPLLVTPARTVTWYCIGEGTAIQQLLDPVVAIGKKRGSGHGHVRRWAVDPVDLDPWTCGHSFPDGRLARPTPAACLDGRPQIRTGGHGTAGLRPPYFHPSRQHRLQLPAPWPGSPGE